MAPALLLACSAAVAIAADVPAPSAPPLFEGLGGLSRPVTTNSPDAQRYFDQGLAFMYAFNHDEAIRSFAWAGTLDPDCAMAWWGVAIANGPHINNPTVPEDRAEAAWEALEKAQAALGDESPVEKALVGTLAARYADPQPQDRVLLDKAYADAMRTVWKAYPKDADVGALFAESLADLRPWDQWAPDGRPQPGTEELLATLDATLALDPKHPLANHLYIHAVEASPHPEWADRAADALRDLQPGLGHLQHMPSHIDVRRGRWQRAVEANAAALVADERYRELSPEQGFYRLYMAHNYHMLTYGAMMTGQSELALGTIREMVDGIPLEFFRENPFADGFKAMPLEVMMRFGRWDDILAEPDFPDFVPISRALQHYARAVSWAAKDEVTKARAEQELFLAARKRVPEDAGFGNNTGWGVLDVAENLMKGEILYRDGQVEAGLAALREAVKKEDLLRYDEPPSWIQPVRHALGAALMQHGRFAEAEEVFREDLARLPENGWGLYGLARTLELQKKKDEAEEAYRRFEETWKRADIVLRTPCLCLPGV